MSVNFIKKGDILIARPSLNDYTFNRTVVLITEHNEQGSVGFILNKSLEQPVNLYVSDLTSKTIVYDGGPVEKSNLYYLHKRPDVIRNSEPISGGLYWSGDYNDVRHGLMSGLIKDDEIRFYLGYSGWAENQLEDELEDNVWVLMNDKLDVFQQWDNNLWKRQMRKLGGENLLWLNTPADPTMN